MSILRIRGGRSLEGAVRVHGAKNSVLPILAASILACGETILHNCPNLSDVDAAIKILVHLGCRVSREGDRVYIDSSYIDRCDIPHELMREMRSSVIFLGAILARTGKAILSMPGGCELGPRPIDLHLASLRALGTEIEEEGGNIVCSVGELKGTKINLSIPSVGATENTMLAASRCKGTTVITNAAREPEIWDLERYLLKLGVRISGAGTSTITIEGSDFEGNAIHSVIPDRIVASTYLAAAAASNGRIILNGVCPAHIATVTNALSDMGCILKIYDETVVLDGREPKRASKPIVTQPYPGFPTDAQPPLMAACLKAEGTTVFVENIFTNRYRHVSELLRMGADVQIEGRVAMVTGVKKLQAAPVTATDLRGGAALVIAALSAEGVTDISGITHIDRGYDDLEGALRILGADIDRID